jgi:hypothetical protein
MSCAETSGAKKSDGARRVRLDFYGRRRAPAKSPCELAGIGTTQLRKSRLNDFRGFPTAGRYATCTICLGHRKSCRVVP